MENNSQVKNIEFRRAIRELVDIKDIRDVTDLELHDYLTVMALRIKDMSNQEKYEMVADNKDCRLSPEIVLSVMNNYCYTENHQNDNDKEIFKSVFRTCMKWCESYIEEAIENVLIDKRRDDIEDGVNNRRQNVNFN